MANTLSLKRRIKSAQNVSKTTKAMQMIAASKLKKAQHQAIASRFYVSSLSRLTERVTDIQTYADDIPYLAPRSESKGSMYIIVSPDKGLCGGLVTNLVREFSQVKQEHDAIFITVGKKIEPIVASAVGSKLIASFPFGTTLPSFDHVLPIMRLIEDYFLSGKIEKVFLVSTHFTSVFSQTPVITQLLPANAERKGESTDFIFEPSADVLLPELLQRYIEMTIYQQLLESYASEQGARMIAMQNATENAKDIVTELQLIYNKARQERITNEILDITSAAMALNE